MFRAGDNSSMLMKWSTMEGKEDVKNRIEGKGAEKEIFSDSGVQVVGRGGRLIQTKIQSGIQRRVKSPMNDADTHDDKYELGKEGNDLESSHATHLVSQPDSQFAEPMGGWLRSYNGGDGHSIVFDDSFEHEVSKL